MTISQLKERDRGGEKEGEGEWERGLVPSWETLDLSPTSRWSFSPVQRFQCETQRRASQAL